MGQLWSLKEDITRGIFNIMYEALTGKKPKYPKP